MQIETTMTQTNGFPNQIRLTEGEMISYYMVDAFGAKFLDGVPVDNINTIPEVAAIIKCKRTELDETGHQGDI